MITLYRAFWFASDAEDGPTGLFRFGESYHPTRDEAVQAVAANVSSWLFDDEDWTNPCANEWREEGLTSLPTCPTEDDLFRAILGFDPEEHGVTLIAVQSPDQLVNLLARHASYLARWARFTGEAVQETPA